MDVVYGGEDYEKQRNSLEQGVDVLIGTPGRLIDYFKQKVFSLNRIQVIVLDEADRMFDLGIHKRHPLRSTSAAAARKTSQSDVFSDPESTRPGISL